MSISTPSPAKYYTTQSFIVNGEKFNCECWLVRKELSMDAPRFWSVDIFHSAGGDLFVDSYEGDDLRSLETYIANNVVSNLEYLLAA
jgi:hypothetical protein